jgi:hypothetical protein
MLGQPSALAVVGGVCAPAGEVFFYLAGLAAVLDALGSLVAAWPFGAMQLHLDRAVNTRGRYVI